MADIADELITYLKTVSAITSLVGSGTNARIYNQDGIPQGALNPTAAGNTRSALSIVKQSDVNSGHLGGRSAMNKATFVITSYAVTPSARNTLAGAVWDAMAPTATTVMGSTPVTEIYTESAGTDIDFGLDGTDQRLYASQATYAIWYYSS